MSERSEAPPGALGASAPAAAAPTPTNSVRPTRESANATAERERAAVVPAPVLAAFRAKGPQYFFPDGALAFRDRGTRLTTASENAAVIEALLSIAAARGWQGVTVRGTERFRREAWLQALAKDLEIAGYAPSVTDREVAARRLSATRAAHESVGEASPAPDTREPPARRAPREALLTGALREHGAAPYRHEPGQPLSYFVTVETGRGPRTVWGVDLERALRESATPLSAGDPIELRSIRREVVTVKTADFEGGYEGASIPKTTYRNRWIIERAGFTAQRAAAAATLRDEQLTPHAGAERHPELVSSYVYLRAAEDLASRQMPNPEDRRRFVSGVRTALAEVIERGEPWLQARLREAVPRREPIRDRPLERGR